MAQRTRWFLAVGILTAVLVGLGWLDSLRLSQQQRRLDAQLAALRAEQERLTAERERLETDPVYVEGLIRTTFKHARKDEYVIPLDRVEERTR